ncbi:hypothetical protein GPECTOR_26g470 [Gonium pectorale]|uniref:IBR domain-containing protein n=1 Tax=Gonium pectorale TaxID=33097 RepID=A0A150GFD6_GONPE|nr:hypothetical protein GPECTOR_26g470 [Gonium pectorale]|eukprot:KXZ48567.1 hypothetical protein GPECTOR_26g470 [Gonium pectorale]
MGDYVRGAVRERRYPVRCPMATGGGTGGCRGVLPREVVVRALARGGSNNAELQAFELLEAEAAIDPPEKVYCPHPGCSCPLERPPSLAALGCQAATCPACRQAFCPRCLKPGPHQGSTGCCPLTATACEAPPSSPPSAGTAGGAAVDAADAALLRLASALGWRRCPACLAMVERGL